MEIMQPIVVRPLASRFPALRSLKSKLAATEGEIHFYDEMLMWLLFSCQEENRCAIEALRRELSDLYNGQFAALQQGMEQLDRLAGSEKERQNVFLDIAHTQLYFKHLDDTLQMLKTKIQRGFSGFIHVHIW